MTAFSPDPHFRFITPGGPVGVALTLALALTAPGAARAAGAAAVTPEQVARALAPVYAQMGAPFDAAQAETRLTAMIDGLADRPDLQTRLPAAIAQGAGLASGAERPASRALAHDLLRDMLWTLADMAGDGPQEPLVAAWQQADPMRAELVPGSGLAESDVAGYVRLKKLAGQPADPGPLMAYWAAQADKPVNRVLPTRLAAWAEGVTAAWDRLTPAERDLATGVVENDAPPPAALVRKITGSPEMMFWIAAVDLPVSAAERQASPDLLKFTASGVFAGPMLEPLAALMAQGNNGAAGMAALGAATNQLMRLNNWSAMTGEMHSWESYRYMTQGY
ncbi:hypothetical protein [Paracoccus jiaweipingae]|uniref:hypothetical protein n=1 Tax=unclassified Paracoccus (in: a-proteobacteria) TaxID=2688777 RepID=UPI0037AA9045